jgi:rhodanese-related sulfurtransferase
MTVPDPEDAMKIAREDLERIIERDEDMLMIDVLPHERYLEKHIPGSISIPLEEPGFVSRVEREVVGREEPIVVYCAGGSCNASREAAHALEAAGFTNVRAFEGGILEWEESGRPLVTGAAAL